MSKGKRIGLVFLQMLVGCCAGVIAGGISLFIVNSIWNGIQNVNMGGFLTAIFVLISFLLVYGIAIIATAEGVHLMGRFVPKTVSRRRLYESTFLAVCAAVALITVTRADWITTLQEWGGPIRLLGTVIYYVIVRPVNLLTFWIPSILLYVIAGPVGAALAYNLKPYEEKSKTEIKE
ncbi:hypothetical protein GF312_07060 [Candidatus Poribacteria bacterium]|nr:hypothetical protein [Candidatus Poribacteria bacterium]